MMCKAPLIFCETLGVFACPVCEAKAIQDDLDNRREFALRKEMNK